MKTGNGKIICSIYAVPGKNKSAPYTMVGLIFHVTCAIDALLDGKKTRECKNKKNILHEYTVDIDKIKQTLATIEKVYSLDINLDEICFILQIIKQS